MAVILKLTETEARALVAACELSRDVWKDTHTSPQGLLLAHAKLVHAMEHQLPPVPVVGSFSFKSDRRT